MRIRRDINERYRGKYKDIDSLQVRMTDVRIPQTLDGNENATIHTNLLTFVGCDLVSKIGDMSTASSFRFDLMLPLPRVQNSQRFSHFVQRNLNWHTAP